jgi:HisJ family histidinol phosphate phosphatase
VHGHAKGEHRAYSEERPISYSARMLFLWFYHACRRGMPRFLMVSDHINYLTFEDPGAVHTVRRALKLAHAGDLYGAAETAGVDVAHASIVSEGLRRGMRFAIGAEADNDPRARPDAQNIVEAMRPDGIIRTVHFINIEHPEKGADWPWPFDNPEFVQFFDHVGTERTWELYIAKLVEDIEKLPGHVVGHFYVPANFGHWPPQKQLEEYEDRMLAAARARGMAVEINTRFLYRDNPEDLKKKYVEANARLMRKAKAAGVPIAIGSDAHSPKDQGHGFELILKMLDDCKINEVVFPVGGRLARVVLKATREHLEAHAKTRETSSPGSSITGFGRAELGLPEEVEGATVGGRARAAREVGPKKRAGDSTRTTKRAESAASAAKSGSRRSAESSSESSKAKASRGADEPPAKKAGTKAAKPPAKTPAPKPAIKAPAAKPPAEKPAKPVKPLKAAAKPAPAKPPAVKPPAAKPAVKKTAVAAAQKKAPPAAKKAPPAKKPVVKKPAAKAVPAKKSPAKKAVAVKKAPAPKKPAPKSAAKPKKPAPKPAAKAPVKKAPPKPAKAPAKGSTTKKKSPAKRR